MEKNKNAIVIGGGPAGMMAAYMIAKNGVPVVLLEKNTKLGKKMLIAGKGRCNLTNDSDMAAFLANMPGNGKFLYSAYRNFSARDVMNWFQDCGVPLKTERGDRVFPESDRSADIVSCLERQLRKAGAKVEFLSEVQAIVLKDESVIGVKVNGVFRPADAVLVATGGCSYPLTGSTGDGFRFAAETGHSVTPPFPSLVPLTVAEDDVKQLEGLSLRNVAVTLKDGDTVLDHRFGELVFTGDGLSGPVILSASRAASLYFTKNPALPLKLVLDLKPALDEKHLNDRLLRDFENFSKRSYIHILEELLPRKIIPVFVKRSGVDPLKSGHQLTKEDRKAILRLLKAFPFTVIRCHPLSEAIVTAGGVSIKEIDPKTMMSKKKMGLYFAGEVLDIDGYTGGFNMQAALSCGYQAGMAISTYCLKGN